jgi:hypothetical protein
MVFQYKIQMIVKAGLIFNQANKLKELKKEKTTKKIKNKEKRRHIYSKHEKKFWSPHRKHMKITVRGVVQIR